MAVEALEDRLKFGQGHRAAEQVALQEITTVGGEEGMLLGGLDALGDDLQVQGVGHDDDRLDNLAILLAPRHVWINDRSILSTSSGRRLR